MGQGKGVIKDYEVRVSYNQEHGEIDKRIRDVPSRMRKVFEGVNKRKRIKKIREGPNGCNFMSKREERNKWL